MTQARWAVGVLISICAVPGAWRSASAADEHPLLGVMESELKLSMEKLETPDGTKPYFVQYSVTDSMSCVVSATLGAVTSDDDNHSRVCEVDVRCGDYTIDNSHQIRGQGGGSYDAGGGYVPLPLNDDETASRHAIWLKTDERFKSAAKRLGQVKANIKVKVEEEDPSDDFTREEPVVRVDPFVRQQIDRGAWAERIRAYSRRFRVHPMIFNSSVTLSGRVSNRLSANSEGSKLQFGRGFWRISIAAATLADDGMELSQATTFDAQSPDGLPDDKTVEAGINQVIADLAALRAAPIVEPYAGPAILMNRATGVFFHEIFGHRIEGHRQKDVDEGQTFAKKLGQPILPDFLSVVDDPSIRVFAPGGASPDAPPTELNGYYLFDDECVPASPAALVENGVLKTFLMSRTPARGITKSNGHGRRQPGQRAVSRQGNLFIRSSKQVPFTDLRSMLLEQCKTQSKEYGLLFKDISGGFTTTRTAGPQAFKVLPILVYRVYADGRADELVRGVDIVGTPLTCFSKILYTADDAAVFNGTCGAESGMIPVSAIAPSVLVEQIEVEKKQKAQNRPPILDAPIAAEKTASSAPAATQPATTNPASETDQTVEQEKKKDVILRAMVDELERNQAGLELPGFERPYYMECTIYDSVTAQVAASLGSVIGSNDRRSRMLVSQVRVGSYESDNTNFRGGGYYSGGGEEAAVPIEDDYNAIRQAIWWAADRNYKSVVEAFAQKQALMKTKLIEDKPADFSRQPAVVDFEPAVTVPVDMARLEKTAAGVSEAFRKYPDLQQSRVWIQVEGGNRYYVNSEGTRLRTGDHLYSLAAYMSLQAPDGMELSDTLTVYAATIDELPSVEELSRQCGERVRRLLAMRDAPKLDSYSGPVLFEAEAAAALFAQRFAENFAGGQRPVGSQTPPDDFSRKIGRRVLPRFMEVVDDPTLETYEGKPVLGHYRYDDQGVKAGRLSVIDGGRLIAQLMSRNPSREFQHSTGHGRNGQATSGCMIVTAKDPADAEALKQELIDSCQDEGLPFGIRIEAPGGAGLAAPLVVHKVFPDGREEPVRGVEVARIDLKAFKRILAAGDKLFVLNTKSAGGQTLIAPAMLFEELDLAKIDRDFDRPPILPAPLARASGE